MIMGYSTWITYGYGICVDDIDTTVNAIETLLEKAPKFRDEIHSYFKDCDIETPTLDDYLDYDQDFYGGLATILQKVISEVDEIELVYADDYNGVKFLLFTRLYPWEMSEREKNFTQDDLTNLFTKYVSILTNQTIDIDYYDVENGG
jgi:hypothetical protein